jgi:hypothetical protein
MKRVITAEDFQALVPVLQSEYKKEGEGYILDLTDYEDPVKLKSAKDHEKLARKTAEDAARKLQEQLDALTEERDAMLAGSIPKKDAEKLETSYKDKLQKQKDLLEGQINAAHTALQKHLVDNVAIQMAAELTESPAVILPHLKGRLKAEKNEAGEFVTKVLDKDGKPSALTIEELKEEFIVHPDFKSIITATKASGGGAGGGKGGGGANSGKVDWNAPAKGIANNLRGRLLTPPGSAS